MIATDGRKSNKTSDGAWTMADTTGSPIIE